MGAETLICGFLYQVVSFIGFAKYGLPRRALIPGTCGVMSPLGNWGEPPRWGSERYRDEPDHARSLQHSLVHEGMVRVNGGLKLKTFRGRTPKLMNYATGSLISLVRGSAISDIVVKLFYVD